MGKAGVVALLRVLVSAPGSRVWTPGPIGWREMTSCSTSTTEVGCGVLETVFIRWVVRVFTSWLSRKPCEGNNAWN